MLGSQNMLGKNWHFHITFQIELQCPLPMVVKTISIFFPFLWGKYQISIQRSKCFNFLFTHMLKLTLIMCTRGLNLDESWFKTSATNCWCLRTFLIFMMRTIAACIKSFLSSSICLCVVSCSIFNSVFIGILMFTLNFLLKCNNINIIYSFMLEELVLVFIPSS